MKLILRNIFVVFLVISLLIVAVSCGNTGNDDDDSTEPTTPPYSDINTDVDTDIDTNIDTNTDTNIDTEPYETILPPDYPPIDTESNQTPIDDDTQKPMETEKGQTGVNLTYSAQATVDLSEKTVTLYFANPSRSLQNMRASLVIGDVTICKSNIINPGNKIESLPLISGVENVLSEGGYDARYLVSCYDPQTNEKAIVELVGAGVVVTVVK